MTPQEIENAIETAIAHHQAGRLVDAKAIYQKVLASQPENSDALHMLGLVAIQTSKFDLAVELIGKSIAINPDLPDAHSNLGSALKSQGKLDLAVASFSRAIELNAEYPEAHFNLGNALLAQEKNDQAIGEYKTAIQCRPQYPDAFCNLGIALFKQGKIDESVVAHSQAIRFNPNYAEAYFNLGHALGASGKTDAAVASYRRAIELKPDHVEAHYNLANALHDQGKMEEAVKCYRQAIRARPTYATNFNNLGCAIKALGQLDEALACFDRSTVLNPANFYPQSNRIYALHFHEDYDAATLLEESRQWDRVYASYYSRQVLPHRNDSTPERRLKIGYLSPDLRGHPVGRSMLLLLNNRNRGRFEMICYNSASQPDALSTQLKNLSDGWHDVKKLSDEHLATKIREDEIDILADTTLHTSGCRPLVFARKPAPVQVTLLGPPTTTGLSAMDYRLTDPFLDPPALGDKYYCEQSVRLPHCFWCYGQNENAPEVNPLPAIANGFITFGCLNQFAKVTPGTLKLWAKVLASVPKSRLIFQTEPGKHADLALRYFQQADIETARIEIVQRMAAADYFRFFHRLDMCLDPFPFNGHTSTMDGFYMGVPVITLRGRTAVGRGGVSLLSNVGLPEFIADTPEQYISIAVQVAKNLPKLAELRGALRQRMIASPLMDAAGYTRDVEAAFREMWRRWCDGIKLV